MCLRNTERSAAGRAGDKLGSGDEIAGYKEPDPPEGTHRYVLMLFRQKDDERTTVRCWHPPAASSVPSS